MSHSAHGKFSPPQESKKPSGIHNIMQFLKNQHNDIGMIKVNVPDNAKLSDSKSTDFVNESKIRGKKKELIKGCIDGLFEISDMKDVTEDEKIAKAVTIFILLIQDKEFSENPIFRNEQIKDFFTNNPTLISAEIMECLKNKINPNDEDDPYFEALSFIEDIKKDINNSLSKNSPAPTKHN